MQACPLQPPRQSDGAQGQPAGVDPQGLSGHQLPPPTLGEAATGPEPESTANPEEADPAGPMTLRMKLLGGLAEHTA
eukprot:scaffold128641_cov18-Prasinocladus_malaysianus.AAC.1